MSRKSNKRIKQGLTMLQHNELGFIKKFKLLISPTMAAAVVGVLMIFGGTAGLTSNSIDDQTQAESPTDTVETDLETVADETSILETSIDESNDNSSEDSSNDNSQSSHGSSVSVSITSNTTTNDDGEVVTVPKVMVNNQEVELSRTGRYRERNRDDNTDTRVDIDIDNDSNSSSSINISASGGN